MQRFFALLLVVVLSLASTGCLATNHTIGEGPRGIEVRLERNWYAFWGLMPVSDNETRGLVGKSSDYRVATRMTTLDVIINFFVFPFSFLRQTTVVEK